ncbi:Uncharacterised protein [Prevotella melaninogenica]|uniref:hypothetical protein n=1 Tax=Prevotella melaninogenica TaxID=28132 RepID=UPI00195A2A44|nr:hypothetical protein [Prevotella melaninogenica]VTY02319.1 Uncharacterised protein [Prevotella melaninogenica]
MERNKYNKAAWLVKRIDELDRICEIERIDLCGLTFDRGGCSFFYVDKELNSKVQELCKSLKEKLEKEFEEL